MALDCWAKSMRTFDTFCRRKKKRIGTQRTHPPISIRKLCADFPFQPSPIVAFFTSTKYRTLKSNIRGSRGARNPSQMCNQMREKTQNIITSQARIDDAMPRHKMKLSNQIYQKILFLPSSRVHRSTLAVSSSSLPPATSNEKWQNRKWRANTTLRFTEIAFCVNLPPHRRQNQLSIISCVRNRIASQLQLQLPFFGSETKSHAVELILWLSVSLHRPKRKIKLFYVRRSPSGKDSLTQKKGEFVGLWNTTSAPRIWFFGIALVLSLPSTIVPHCNGNRSNGYGGDREKKIEDNGHTIDQTRKREMCKRSALDLNARRNSLIRGIHSICGWIKLMDLLNRTTTKLSFVVRKICQ